MAQKAKEAAGEPDLRPDGWDRFEKAVDAAVKSGPKHKAGTAPKPARKPRKGTSGTNA